MRATDHHRVRPSATGAPPTRPPPPCNLQASAHHGVPASPQVRGRSPYLTYYNLLVHLARGPTIGTTERRDERVWSILETIERRIAAEFGPGFVLVNDFFSFRAPSVRMFQNWHQARRPEHS